MEILPESLHSPPVQRLSEVSGAKLLRCYQCGRCSAGCPMAAHMDVLPHQVLRHAQMGHVREVTASRTPFVCAACLACSVRCPRGVPIAEVMEALRTMVLRERSSDRRLRLNPEERAGLPAIALICAYRKVVE